MAEGIRRAYEALLPEMDERMRRQWAAAEARRLGYGGVTAVSRAVGISRTTIEPVLRNWICRSGDGRAKRREFAGPVADDGRWPRATRNCLERWSR